MLKLSSKLLCFQFVVNQTFTLRRICNSETQSHQSYIHSSVMMCLKYIFYHTEHRFKISSARGYKVCRSPKQSVPVFSLYFQLRPQRSLFSLRLDLLDHSAASNNVRTTVLVLYIYRENYRRVNTYTLAPTVLLVGIQAYSYLLKALRKSKPIKDRLNSAVSCLLGRRESLDLFRGCYSFLQEVWLELRSRAV